jgi:hypothetical protein
MGKNMRSGRINAIARLANAKKYLEIGVNKGETFFEVDIDYKVAVDPNFLFDFNSKETEKARFHPITSDEFFRQNRETFDIIYLDGLHTFDQTLRDFMSSLAFAHDRTIWLLDDTMPNDNFSALSDQERCYRLCRQLGNGDWAWMGDVFKTVYFIRNAMKFYNYRTFTGHGQTVVWKDIEKFGDGITVPADKVGAMTYEDYVDTYQSMMNIESDDKIYSNIGEFLSR